MDTAKIYWALALASIRARMEYKSSFIFYIFAIVFFYLGQVGLLLVILTRFNSIQGWSLGEMAFLYGLLAFAQGFANLFFAPLMSFEQLILRGDFDRNLVRPLNPLMQVIVSKFEASSFAHFIVGSAALWFGNHMVDMHWTAMKIFYFPLVVIGGVLIAGAIRIAVTAVSFWTVRNATLVRTIVFSSKEFVIYPLTIYNFGIQFMLTFIFPLGFINFYPAHYFLGRDSSLLLHPMLQFGTPLVGVIAFWLALKAWEFGVDHYHSTGS